MKKKISDKEYNSSLKSWENERLWLINSLEHEKERYDKLVNDTITIYKDTVEFSEQILVPLELDKSFTLGIFSDLRSKTNRYLKGRLTDDDLDFVGDYALYEVVDDRALLLKNVGLKKETPQFINIKQSKNNIIAMMLNNDNYYNRKNDTISFLFFKKNKKIVMEIEISEYYKEYFYSNNRYVRTLLYDSIDICLNMIEK